MEVKNYLKSVAMSGLLALSLAGCGGTDEKGVTDIYDLTVKQERVDYSRKSVAFIIDTSPSMGSHLDRERKIDSAKKSLLDILGTYNDYNMVHTNLEAGLFCFGNERVINPVSIANFNYEVLANAVKGLDSNGSGTPLGVSLAYAKRELLKRATGKNCIVALTDGQSNIGKDPYEVLDLIRQADSSRGSTTEVYCVAFDVSRDAFEGLEKLGAKIYTAKNSGELDEVLKVNTALLLEEPEVPTLK